LGGFYGKKILHYYPAQGKMEEFETPRLIAASHNTLRGAASGSILNAELLVAEGFLA
jgi:hypothetical protein